MATQQAVSEHLDLSTRQIRNLVSAGILPASKGKGGLDIEACRIAYIRYLRGVQSGQVNPSGEKGDDEQKNFPLLIEEEKYRKMKRENDIDEDKVASVELLTEALEKSGNIIIPILESLPLLIKRKWPEITGDQITLVKMAIADCRNAIADSNIEMAK